MRGLRASSLVQVMNLVKKLLFINETSVLKIGNLPKETDYITAMKIFAAFSQLERNRKCSLTIKKSFYFSFASAESTATAPAHLKTKNLNILGHTLVSSIQDI